MPTATGVVLGRSCALTCALLICGALAAAGAPPAGDWPTLGASPRHAGVVAGSLAGSRGVLAWSVAIPEGAEAAFAAGRIYLSDHMAVSCLDAASGAQLWRREIGPGIGAPTVDGDLLFVHKTDWFNDAKLVALAVADGSVRWTATMPVSIAGFAAPLVAGGRVYVHHDGASAVHAFDRASGAVRFASADSGAIGRRTPAFADGRLIDVNRQFLRHRDPATGVLRATLDLGQDPFSLALSTPILDAGRAYVADGRGLMAVDLASMTQVWSMSGDLMPEPPAVGGGEVYVPYLNRLRLLRASDGAQLAEVELEEQSPYYNEQVTYGQPVLCDDSVLLATADRVIVLARGTLAQREILPIGGRPMLAGGALFLVDGVRNLLHRVDWVSTAGDPRASIAVTRGGAAVAEGATVAGSVRMTVTVTNAIGRRLRLFGNFLQQAPIEEITTSPFTRSVDVDTTAFFDGENLLSAQVIPRVVADQPLPTDLHFATFKVLTANGRPAPDGDVALPRFRPYPASFQQVADRGGHELIGDGTLFDDNGVPLLIGNDSGGSNQAIVFPLLGASPLGRGMWHQTTPPFADGPLIHVADARPFLTDRERFARCVFFCCDGAGRASYATYPVRLAARSAADAAALPRPVVQATTLNIRDGDEVVVPDGADFLVHVRIDNPFPTTDGFHSLITWVGNRSVSVTPLAGLLDDLPRSTASVEVVARIPASELHILELTRQRGLATSAFPIWHTFQSGNHEHVIDSYHLANVRWVSPKSIRTASAAWPDATPRLRIDQPWAGAQVPGPELAVRYSIGGSRQGVAAVRARLDQRPTVDDADLDGAISLAGVGVGAHTLVLTLVDAAGQPLPQPSATASVSFTVANQAPTAVVDGYRVAAGGTLTVARAAGVLANDRDPEGGALSAVLVRAPLHGTVTLAADGGFTYRPAAGFSGFDTFLYAASDGGASSRPGIAQVVVTPASPSIPGRWTTFGNGPGHSGRVAGSWGARSAQLAWQRDDNINYYVDYRQPVIADGKVFLNLRSGGDPTRIVAVDAATGTQSWVREFPADHTLAAMAWHGGALFTQATQHYSSEPPRMWAIAASNGVTRWSDPLFARNIYPPCVVNDRVVVLADEFVAFDLTSGTRRFVQPMSTSEHTSPTFAEGRLHTLLGGVVREHDLQTGSELRRLDVGQSLFGGDSGTTVAVAAEGRVLTATTFGLTAIDPATLTPVWRRRVPSTYRQTSPAVADGMVYQYAFDTLEVRSLADGVLHASVQFPGVGVRPGSYLYGQPIVADDVIVVSVYDETYIVARESLSILAVLPYGGEASLGENTLCIAGLGRDPHPLGENTRLVTCYRLTTANQPPQPGADSFHTTVGRPLTVLAAGLLANDREPNGEPMTASLVSGPAHGTVQVRADGGFSYTPAAGYIGADAFSYRVTDSRGGSATASAALTVHPLPLLRLTVEGEMDEGTIGAYVHVERIAGQPDVALTVDLVYGGTAGSSDLGELPAQVTIPAGGVSTSVFLFGIHDGLVEGPETVTVAVRPRADYRLDQSAPVVATLLDRDDRLLLHINFQPTNAPVPDGYRKDDGSAYGPRAGGYTYGWSKDIRGNAVTSIPDSSDPSATNIRTQVGGDHRWELALPDGDYGVDLFAGDPQVMSGAAYRFSVEGQPILSGDAVEFQRIFIGSTSMRVSDGRLTLTNGTGAVGNRAAFIIVGSSRHLPVLRLTASDAAASETGDAGRFTISRSGSTAAALTVRLATSGSASSGSDYHTLPTTVTIPVGQSAVDVVLTPKNDTLAEPPTETVVVTLVPESAYVIATGAGAATATIADDGDLPAVTVTAVDAFAYEGGSGAPDHGKFRVSRTGPTTAALVVALTASGATPGSDYQALPATVTIPAGKASLDVPLTVIDDLVVESFERVTWTVAARAGYVIASPSSASVLVIDDEFFALDIDFQPAAAAVPDGFVIDSGSAFAARGNGFSYGWSASNNNTVDRNAAASPSQAHDTLIHTQKNGSFTWEIAVPNGTYEVSVVCGDATAFDSRYQFRAEGVTLIDATPTSAVRWASGTAVVTVSDGRLSIANGPSAVNGKLCCLHIRQAPAAGN